MMRKSMFIWILVLTIVMLLSVWYIFSQVKFGPGYQDFTKSITGGYMLYRTSKYSVFIAPKDGWSSEDAIIPEKVLRLNDYKSFIVAERQGLKRRSPDDTSDMYLVPDSTTLDYWIIDTDKRTFTRYLKIQEFELKMDSLKIPKELKLIGVYEY